MPSQSDEFESIDVAISAIEQAIEKGVIQNPSEWFDRYPKHEELLADFFSREKQLRKLSFSGRSSQPSKTLQPSTMLDEYRLVRMISQTVGSSVWIAEDTSLRRLVALKTLQCESEDEHRRLRFIYESEAIARLNCPHIVPIFGAGHQEEVLYFAMKLADTDLKQCFESYDGHPKWIAKTMKHLSDAVQCAHDAGILHRDLKPSNVLLLQPAGSFADEWTPLLADFGLAKDFQTGGGITRTGAVVGTPWYLSPEQAKGLSQWTNASTDVWGLGAILYFLLTGKAPFEADSEIGAIRRAAVCDYPLPSQVRQSVDRDLETICLKCLRSEPSERYASAKELADDLNRFYKGQPIEARRWTKFQKTYKWIQRNPYPSALFAVTGSAACLIVGISSYFQFQGIRYQETLQKALAQAESSATLAQANEDLALAAAKEYFEFAFEDLPTMQLTGAEIRRELLNKAKRFNAELANRNPGSYLSRSHIASANYMMALVHGEMGQINEAIRYGETSLSLYAGMKDLISTQLRITREAVVYNALARFYRAANQIDRSQESYEKAIELWSQASLVEPNDEEIWATKAVAELGLGKLLSLKRQMERIRPLFESAANNMQRACELAPDNIKFELEAAKINESLGALAWVEQDRTHALKRFEDSLKIYERLAIKSPDHRHNELSIANVIMNIGSLHTELTGLDSAVSQHHYQLAVKHLQEASNRFQVLADNNPKLITYPLQLGRAKNQLALMLLGNDDTRANQLADESIAIFAAIMGKELKDQSQQDVYCQAYEAKARACLNLQDIDQATSNLLIANELDRGSRSGHLALLRIDLALKREKWSDVISVLTETLWEKQIDAPILQFEAARRWCRLVKLTAPDRLPAPWDQTAIQAQVESVLRASVKAGHPNPSHFLDCPDLNSLLDKSLLMQVAQR
jgi:eukaryotic-like serine/threonine-protein kinase